MTPSAGRAEARIDKTGSRQILGSMNDFAYLMEAYPLDRLSLEDVAVKLASTPCGPIGMKYPVDVALDLLATRG